MFERVREVTEQDIEKFKSSANEKCRALFFPQTKQLPSTRISRFVLFASGTNISQVLYYHVRNEEARKIADILAEMKIERTMQQQDVDYSRVTIPSGDTNFLLQLIKLTRIDILKDLWVKYPDEMQRIYLSDDKGYIQFSVLLSESETPEAKEDRMGCELQIYSQIRRFFRGLLMYDDDSHNRHPIGIQSTGMTYEGLLDLIQQAKAIYDGYYAIHDIVLAQQPRGIAGIITSYVAGFNPEEKVISRRLGS